MTSIEQRIQADVKAAMKAGEKDRLLVLRTVMSEAKNEAIAAGGERTGLDDELMTTVLRRAIKRRVEAAEIAERNDRPEHAANERAQIEVIEAYLPRQMPDDELAAIVAAAIDETGAETKKDMGKVMGLVMQRTAGRADGKRVSALVASKLG